MSSLWGPSVIAHARFKVNTSDLTERKFRVCVCVYSFKVNTSDSTERKFHVCVCVCILLLNQDILTIMKCC